MIEPLVVMALAALGVGGAVTRIPSRIRDRLRISKLVASTPEAQAGVADGTVVRVTGTVRAIDELLVAPLSGRRVVLYRARVIAGAKTPGLQETLGTSLFAIERTDARAVIVDANSALLDLPSVPRKVFTAERKDHFLLLNGHGAAVANNRFDEVIVEPGARVTVIGLAMLDANPEPTADERGFREELPVQLRIVGDREYPLVITRARSS